MNWWERLDGPLLGRYRIERVLGEGGMARVFVATDLKFNRQVAIKTPKLESFPPDRAAELLKRFTREFRSQAEDPIHGVVPVYDAGEVVDGDGVSRPILVMQYLTGGSLSQRLGGRVGARTHRQTLSEVLEWLLPIAAAIDSVHQRRFLHRDIKPDNILFNRDERPFLADFGVVGMLDTSTGLESSTLGPGATGASQPPGSPGYQPPESIRADGMTNKSPASDQFSLAITVYEALSGVLPVQVGTSAEWYGALMHWSPTPLAQHCPQLPLAAADAVMKAMSLHTSDRFLSCSDFARAIDRASAAHLASAPPHVAAPPPLRPAPTASSMPPVATLAVPRKPRGPFFVGALVGALLLIAVAWNYYQTMYAPATQDPPPPAEVAASADSATDGIEIAPASEVLTVDSGEPLPPAAPATLATPAAATVATAAGGLAPATLVARAASCESRDSDNDGVGDCDDMCEFSSGPPARHGCQVSKLHVVYFQFDRTELDADAAAVLESVVAAARADPPSRLLVSGHSSGGDAHGISERRARSVADFLASGGIDTSRLTTRGLEFSRPASVINDESGWAMNRRVEILLLK